MDMLQNPVEHSRERGYMFFHTLLLWDVEEIQLKFYFSLVSRGGMGESLGSGDI